MQGSGEGFQENWYLGWASGWYRGLWTRKWTHAALGRRDGIDRILKAIMKGVGTESEGTCVSLPCRSWESLKV